MIVDSALSQVAADLLRARDTVSLTALPSRSQARFDLDKGYQVGRALHEGLVGRGYAPVGRKIGFTNRATWEEFHLDTPIWAHMYAETVKFANGAGLRLSLGGMVAPRIETEVVLKLRRPIQAADPSVEDLADCVEWAAIGFEFVDCHGPDWRFTAADAVADFGLHATLVVGTPWILDSEDPRRVARQMQELKVTLSRGAAIVAQGEGRNALGSPLLALGHLARVVRSQSWASPLSNGELITTGTLTPLPPVSAREHWSARVTGAPLAPLEVDLVD